MPTVAADLFKMFNIPFTGPADNASLVTPSDVDEISVVSRELWIGVAGTLRVTTYGGQDITLPASVVGLGKLTLRVRKVWATGTTASGIVAVW